MLMVILISLVAFLVVVLLIFELRNLYKLKHQLEDVEADRQGVDVSERIKRSNIDLLFLSGCLLFILCMAAYLQSDSYESSNVYWMFKML